MIAATGSSDTAIALGLAALGAAAVWAGLVACFAVATRAKTPEAIPAGLEPGGDESPALVNFITSGWKVRGEAVSSTLVDLAARHAIRFEQTSPDHFTVTLDKPDVPMTRYERQVLDVVRRLATNGSVPCDALTLGTESQAASFHKSFKADVIADARQRGLSRPRWSAAMNLVVGAVAVAPALLAAGALVALPDSHHTTSSSSNDNPIGAFAGIALFTWAALMAGFRWLRAERDTPAGMAAAGRWLGLRENLEADGTFPDLEPTAVAVWDRYLAYGVALGVAANTERTIPLGAESDTEAWSPVGGRWRIVRVRYPRRFPPGWGRPPWKVLFAGLFAAGGAAAIAYFVLPAVFDVQDDFVTTATSTATAQDRQIVFGITAGLTIAGVALALVAMRGLCMIVLALLDIGRGRAVDGRVLRVRSRDKRTYVAVDDGADDHVRAWVSAVGGNQGADVRHGVPRTSATSARSRISRPLRRTLLAERPIPVGEPAQSMVGTGL